MRFKPALTKDDLKTTQDHNSDLPDLRELLWEVAAACAGAANARLLPSGLVVNRANLGRVIARDARKRASGSGPAEAVILPMKEVHVAA